MTQLCEATVSTATTVYTRDDWKGVTMIGKMNPIAKKSALRNRRIER